jgi:GNAT superfamily N-acetyltransferase
MSEKSFTRARRNAATLVADIIDSTAHFYYPWIPPDAYAPLPRELDALEVELEQGIFWIGFEKNFPFGFVGISAREGAGRLIGPYLYRDYLGQGYGKALLDKALETVQELGLNPAYALAHREAEWALNFYRRWGFEVVSDDPEFIARWCDGLLANEQIPNDHLLLATLTENLFSE